MKTKQSTKKQWSPTADAPALASHPLRSPGARSGQGPEEPKETLTLEWIAALAASARFWRTLVVVKRKVFDQTLEPRERKRRDSHGGQVDKSGRKTR